MARKSRRRHRSRGFKRFLNMLFVVLLVAGVGAGGYSYAAIKSAPTITQTAIAAKPDADGHRVYVTYDEIPARYKDALIATEDRTFETNNGVNFNGVVNLFVTGIKSLFGQGEARGGSSITQQLVKLTAFSTEAKDQTVKRKIQEIWLARQITKQYSKDQLLEYYVNKIYEGHNQYGAQTIAGYYYGVSLSKLDTSQTAIIAGLGQSPSRYDLYTAPDLVKERRDTVLAAMLATKRISQADYQTARAESVTAGLIQR